MALTTTYTVADLKQIVSEFLRRADEDEEQAKAVKVTTVKRRVALHAQADTWRLAASILDRTTITGS